MEKVFRIKEELGLFFIETKKHYDELKFNWRTFDHEVVESKEYYWIAYNSNNNGGKGFSDLNSAKNKIDELIKPIIYHNV
ncbi:MAG: hypothetical protein AABY22_15265 [Nanoarchaeota archaeon]